MKKEDMILEMGRCLKNVLIDGDPKQLFQRLVVAGKETVDTQILFTYELSSYHTSLFDSLLTDKASLEAALIKKVPLCVIRQYPDDVQMTLCMSLMGAHSCKNCRGPTRQHMQTYPICMYNMYIATTSMLLWYLMAMQVTLLLGRKHIKDAQAHRISVQRSILSQKCS